jgi:hypothetical protein
VKKEIAHATTAKSIPGGLDRIILLHTYRRYFTGPEGNGLAIVKGTEMLRCQPLF